MGMKTENQRQSNYFISTVTSCPLSLFFPKCPAQGESRIPVLTLRAESSAEAEERERKTGKSQQPPAAGMRQLQAGSTESVAGGVTSPGQRVGWLSCSGF